jgi:Xaa-Pro aminopeptidase
MVEPSPAILIIATSEHDSNLYWASGFLAPDAFIYLQLGDRKLLVMNDLELDRAKAQSRVDEVLAYAAYEARAKQRVARPTLIDTLAEVLEERQVSEVLVPASFGVEHADRLRERGIKLAWKRDPFFEARVVKRPDEVAAIEATQRATERAVGRALDALRESDIRGDRLYWRGEVLTAEILRRIMHTSFMEDECLGQHTIVAPGVQGVDPHNEGSGPILPHQSLVLDVFPRSTKTRYWADMTRTVVRGRASDQLKRMYDAVLAAQLRGIELCADAVDGQAVHQEVTAVLERAGFETGMVDGRMQGFFHGTGHGVGLDIHEAPRISKVSSILNTGHVVTVEPGLYYSRWGAVRIEDMVLIQPGGCRNLTDFPKTLEI